MHLFAQLLELCFPTHPTVREARAVSRETVITRSQLMHLPHALALTSYADRDVRACILATKFYREKSAIAVLAALLVHHLEQRAPHDAILIPIPLSPERQRERGYNQVAVVAHAARRILPTLTVEESLLRRTRNTPPQTDLARAERLENMQDAFRLRNPEKAAARLNGATVILLDDVVTTGATLAAAKAALSPLPTASLTCLALAH